MIRNLDKKDHTESYIWINMITVYLQISLVSFQGSLTARSDDIHSLQARAKRSATSSLRGFRSSERKSGWWYTYPWFMVNNGE